MGLQNLSGKIAVLTGGSNGIGLAAAQELAGCGAEVWIFDLEREHPGDVAAQFGAKGFVSRRRVAEVELIESIHSQRSMLCSTPSLRQYMGRKYTRMRQSTRLVRGIDGLCSFSSASEIPQA
jgi:NAD(P)-dependent dehydrogenase (short-subunit alcohol dehydrogenase family)